MDFMPRCPLADTCLVERALSLLMQEIYFEYCRRKMLQIYPYHVFKKGSFCVIPRKGESKKKNEKQKKTSVKA